MTATLHITCAASNSLNGATANVPPGEDEGVNVRIHR
jgi:hypothetical protein